MTRVAFTVDLEQDCPPYLDSYRGAEEGMPRLLALLRAHDVRATVFATGDIARRYPDLIRAIVAAGHELGSHGDTHRAFDRMSDADAASEIARSTDVLRRFAPVHAFRAPYLRLPTRHRALLRASGYRIDSSEGAYKRAGAGFRGNDELARVPASITSSALRLPAKLRDALLSVLGEPVVLFVHPWEIVDLSGLRLRWDCRVATGAYAERALDGSLRRMRARGATFHTLSGLVEEFRREDAREQSHQADRDAVHGNRA